MTDAFPPGGVEVDPRLRQVAREPADPPHHHRVDLAREALESGPELRARPVGTGPVELGDDIGQLQPRSAVARSMLARWTSSLLSSGPERPPISDTRM
jgi:hypothetical protein